MAAILFILFAGLAIGCAISMVAQRNPLYIAISLIGVFVSLACLYVTLGAPFIAAVQVIVYAGAIMVLVVFVIMLLGLREPNRTDRLLVRHYVGVVFLGLFVAALIYVQNRTLDSGTGLFGGGSRVVHTAQELDALGSRWAQSDVSGSE